MQWNKYDFRMKYIIHQRTLKAHFYPDFMFNTFGYGKDEKKYIKILHEFTSKVRWIGLQLGSGHSLWSLVCKVKKFTGNNEP